jgi:hypothetical protein
MGVISHGMTRTPTYVSWVAMKQRCLNEKDPSYRRYGGRGIKVCRRWLKFENFLTDMGERPSGTSLDRFPNNHGPYAKSNCRWATPRQQAEARRQRIGVDHHSAKLTENDVRKIRQLYRPRLAAHLSRTFGVSDSTIIRIVQRKIWRHVG